ncbi:MAG: MarR family winged helix-turn-helix transcriptional regulator [Solirubrobacterales bacterium]
MHARPRIDAREDFDLAWDEFFGAIRRARGRAAQEAEREGLSLAQFQLIFPFAELHRGDGLSVGALAEAAGVAQPTATRTLDGLERDGIVERRPSSEDRRSVTVHLTAAGHRLLKRKRDLVARKRRAVYESLEPADRERAPALLRALAAAIEESR